MDIHFDISPSLHPRKVENINGYEQHAASLGLVHGAFVAAYEGLATIHNARKSVANNPTLNEAARIIKVADFAEKKQDAITKKFDAAYKNLSAAIKTTEEALNEPITGTSGVSGNLLNGEIRSYVRGLPREERYKFLAEAQASGDAQTLVAVLGAPAYLSGISEAQRAAYTRRFHMANNPELAARLDVMKTGLRLLEESAPIVLTEVEKAIGADWRKVQRLKQARDEAERAFSS